MANQKELTIRNFCLPFARQIIALTSRIERKYWSLVRKYWSLVPEETLSTPHADVHLHFLESRAATISHCTFPSVVCTLHQ